VAAAAVAVAQVGHTGEQLNRASLFGGLRRLPERFTDRAAELHERFAPRQFPAGPIFALVPFFEYVDRCTTEQHRLLLPGFLPEVAVYARRPFAGGRSSFFPGILSSPADMEFTRNRLAHEVIPFAIMSSPWREGVASAFPDVSGFIAARFDVLASYPFRGSRVDVFYNRTLAPVGRDAATGWPCFR
jgi:hypothetical protein